MDWHAKCSHLGSEFTLADLRYSDYYVPQARQAVNKVLAYCFQCNRHSTRSILPSSVARLPAPQVDFEVSFKWTGVDYTRHLWVKERTKERKMYLRLFTWLWTSRWFRICECFVFFFSKPQYVLPTCAEYRSHFTAITQTPSGAAGHCFVAYLSSRNTRTNSAPPV